MTRQACWYRGLHYNETAMPRELQLRRFCSLCPFCLTYSAQGCCSPRAWPRGLAAPSAQSRPTSSRRMLRRTMRPSATALRVLGRRPAAALAGLPATVASATARRHATCPRDGMLGPTGRLPDFASASRQQRSPHSRPLSCRRRMRVALCTHAPATDAWTDHRSACAMSGFLASWAFLHLSRGRSTSTAERAGCRHEVPVSDARRPEVVDNGLLICHGTQLAIDATILSPVMRTRSAWPGADTQKA